MSNFPLNFDDDTTLPIVNNNLTEIGGEAINAIRDATFNIEQYLGLGANGTTLSIANRLGVSLNPDGSLKSSAIAALGLVTLPITNNQIANNADILESKLKLDFKTSTLYNYIKDLSLDINNALNWISASGVKFEPHIAGALYKHNLDHINVSSSTANYLKSKFRVNRNNTNSYTLIHAMNDELLQHQFADSSYVTMPSVVVTNNGSSYTSNYAHTSSGIYLNTSRFSSIPQTKNDLQQFAEYIDSASIFLLGTRIQNLYSNGISRESRSSNLVKDGYGQFILSSTPVTTYLLGNGSGSSPVDNIDNGDDIIEFKPLTADLTSNIFDTKFALIKIGDIIRVNYDGIEISHIVKEKKYLQNGGNKKYIVRINGKNYKYSTTASARIDKPLFNPNKFGVLSLSAANNNFSAMPSLIVGSPRGAMALGVGFNPDLLDAQHYLLYLAIYPTGRAEDGYTILPGIDVTGNLGTTPGKYTLSSVVEATNNAFRNNGFNYRFVAFQHQGEFGVALADSYNNAAFSIFSAVVASDGTYNSAATSISFPDNVVGIFPASATFTAPDPLGFGPYKANLASPPYRTTYGSPEAAQNPTKLFVPLKRNNFYVNGVEIDKFSAVAGQLLDGYGDGYWAATVLSKNIIPGAPPTGRVQTTYRINQDISSSKIFVGKTIVVQSLSSGTIVNFGRFTIENIGCGCAPATYTDITVYDAVHGTGISPSTTLNTGTQVAIYFNDDSVSFNAETATDFVTVPSSFKRHFEVYINEFGNTFTHERARANVSGSNLTINDSIVIRSHSEASKLNIVKVSSKLRGYQFGSVNKITLRFLSFTDGVFSVQLCSYDGTNFTKTGQVKTGRVGQLVRVYDETNIDYVDIIFDLDTTVSNFSNQVIDIQLFPTLSLDNEIMLLGTCQLNDVTKKITHIRDERQFGNVSEKDLTTSALNFISMGEKLLHSNGVIRGFDLENRNADPNPNSYQVYMTGGVALINGKFVQVNSQTVSIPIIKELYNSIQYNINWALCVNDKGEYQPIPLLDYDASFATPNNPARKFVGYNVANGLTYDLDASTFSNIVNSRKDLVLLYIVSSTVTILPVAISLVLNDVRKYANDADSNLPLKLTSGEAQGNFRSPTAVLNWLKYNNSFNGTAIVKGATVNSGIISTSLNLNFASEVVIDGQNNATLTMNEPVILGSNIVFKNLTIKFEKGVSVASSITNLTFDNCRIYVNNTLTVSPPINNVIFYFNNASNILIKDCFLLVNYPIQSTGGAIFRLNNTNSFLMDGCELNCNFNYDSSTQVPGDIFIINYSPNFTVTNSYFDSNFNQFIRNTFSNNLLLRNLTITCSFNPGVGPSVYNSTTDPLGAADGLPNLTYSSSNLVNTGRGSFMYSKVSSTLDDIIIDDVSFTSTSGANRLSLINFELSSNVSVLSNLSITNCKFYNTNTGGSVEDIRPIVAIVNTATSTPTTVTDQQPLLKNVVIENNYCNRNQSIIFTSKLDGSSRMIYPGLVTQNCVIKNNQCGMIGYWIASSSKVINLPPNINNFTDKESSLIIEGNNCHFITNVDHTGTYFVAARAATYSTNTTNRCDYPSGNVIIQNNNCNWIHTSVAYEEKSSLKILNNYLSAYSQDYLNNYGHTLSNSTDARLSTSRSYAIYVNTNKLVTASSTSPGEGNDAACIISGNVTSKGYWVQSNGVLVNYNYGGYIFCSSSNIISSNILKGVGGSSYNLIAIYGRYNLVNHNMIYRQSEPVFSYINYVNTTFNAVSFSSYGIITENIFDSPYIDATLSENTIGSSVPVNWTVERNKNQTSSINIPITNGLFPYGRLGIENYGVTDPQYLCITTVPNRNGINFKSNVLWIHDKYNSVGNPIAQEIRVGWQENIDKYLPNNVKIIQCTIGVKRFGSLYQITPFASSIKLFLNKYESNALYYNLNNFISAPSDAISSSYIAGVADSRLVYDNTPDTTPYVEITGGQINATMSSISSTIDLQAIDPATGSSGSSDYTENYITSKGYSISLSLDVKLKKPLNNDDADLYISPIYVKYRW